MPQKKLRTASKPRAPRGDLPLVDLEPRPLGGFGVDELYAGAGEEEFEETLEEAPLPPNGRGRILSEPAPVFPRPTLDHPAAAALRVIAAPVMTASSHALGQLQQILEAEVSVRTVISPEVFARTREAQARAAGLYEEIGKVLWLLRPAQ